MSLNIKILQNWIQFFKIKLCLIFVKSIVIFKIYSFLTLIYYKFILQLVVCFKNIVYFKF